MPFVIINNFSLSCCKLMCPEVGQNMKTSLASAWNSTFLLFAGLVTSPSPRAFSVVCQYPSLMCSLVSVMAWSYTVMSQKGHLRQQTLFKFFPCNSYSRADKQSSPLLYSGLHLLCGLQNYSCALLCFRVSAVWKEPSEAVSILTASKLLVYCMD